MPNKAFSLVELSIVLVILGLLTGGILAGQSLIRAAEIRSVSADFNRYSAASMAFRDKYMALPGDMRNATSFWGTDSGGCPNGGGSTGTCNGNGDGIIGNGTLGNTCENQEFWRQLALAGLIEGKYTPQTAANCFSNSIPGTDSAKLRIADSGMLITYVGPVTTNASFPGTVVFQGNYQNVYFIARVGGTNGVPLTPMLKPEEQWSVDTKLDDGLPGKGNVLSVYPGTYTNAAGSTGCVTTSSADTAAYTLTNSSLVCSLVIKSGF